MITDIQTIFDGITPDNIKNIPVIQDAIKIFIETIEDLAAESIDIKEFYNNGAIKDQLVQIYLEDLYNVIKEIQFNEKLIAKIEKIDRIYQQNGANDYEYLIKDRIENPSNYFNEEHFLSFKAFKQKKGTIAGINYIYELFNQFVTPLDEKMPLVVTEIEPFNMKLEGSLPLEFYQYLIYPLAHPLGFTYTYERYLNFSFTDYFPCEKFKYDVKAIEVRCIIGKNIATADYMDRTVKKIHTYNSGTYRYKVVDFEDGSYLQQETALSGQAHVYEYDSNGDLTEAYTPYHCSLYIDYTYELDTCIGDSGMIVTQSSLLQDNVTEPEDILHTTTIETNLSGNQYFQYLDNLAYAKKDLYLNSNMSPIVNNSTLMEYQEIIDGYQLFIGGVTTDEQIKKIGGGFKIGFPEPFSSGFIKKWINAEPFNVQTEADEALGITNTYEMVDDFFDRTNRPKIQHQFSENSSQFGNDLVYGGELIINGDDEETNPDSSWFDNINIGVYRDNELIPDGNLSAL